MDKTELRLDPLTQQWTIFSAARALPPDFGSVRAEASAASPFTPGREELTPPALHTAGTPWQVRVVPNRAPAVRVEGDAQPRSDGFYDRMDGVGAHEVIIEHPGGAALEDLDLGDLGKVIAAWKARMLDLMRDPKLRTFTVVKNVGAAAGGRVSHSVSQLVALSFVPPVLRRKLDSAREFFARKRRSIFEDILAEEFRTGSRLVYENNGFTVFCPYAARAPFELALYPKRQCADLHGLTDQETAQFADALRSALRLLNAALDHPPFNLMLFTAPVRTARRDYWNTIEQDFRWHVEILPRLHHLGGVELATGAWINSVWPETAAAHLRSLEVHR